MLYKMATLWNLDLMYKRLWKHSLFLSNSKKYSKNYVKLWNFGIILVRDKDK